MMQMTCENHPDLFWSCKMQAVSKSGRYTGARNIFFMGKLGLDGKMIDRYNDDNEPIRECDCPGSKLIATDMNFVREWHEKESNRWG